MNDRQRTAVNTNAHVFDVYPEEHRHVFDAHPEDLRRRQRIELECRNFWIIMWPWRDVT